MLGSYLVMLFSEVGELLTYRADVSFWELALRIEPTSLYSGGSLYFLIPET